jgi:vesicle-associated membrane protein 4
MRQNITRVQERGENVDRLGDKTQGLSDSAANFRRGANRVRKQMFWKNMKMRVWLIIGVIVLILLIAIPSKLFLAYLGIVGRGEADQAAVAVVKGK